MLQGDALEAALTRLPTQSAEGTAYRVIPAQYHLTALSSVGSLQHGGRYNPRGQLEALYLSDSPITALQEIDAIQQTSSRLIGRKTGPKTLLSVDYLLQRLVNLTDTETRNALHVTLQDLLGPWVLEQTVTEVAPTQRLGLAIAGAGIEALRVPSSKNPSSSNLVIFPRTVLEGSWLRVYDDSGFIDARLP
jgi:RES domain-containing protein